MHLEADKFIPGNILFSERYAIRTTDGSITSTIAGNDSLYGYEEGIGSSARFNHVSSLVQVSATTVILADERNSCLRRLNRWTAMTSQFAGNCSNSQYYPKDGSEPTFLYPRSIIVDQKFWGQLLVGDSHFLRSVTFIGMPIARTLFQYEHSIIEITQDLMSGYIYILGYWSLVRFDRMKNESITLAGEYGDYLQDLALFSEKIRMFDMIILSDKTFLVSAPVKMELIMIDLNLNMTFPICASIRSKFKGNLNSCEHSQPMSLAVIGRTLFFGDRLNDEIRTVSGMSRKDPE